MDTTARLADELTCVIEELLPEFSQEKIVPRQCRAPRWRRISIKSFHSSGSPINRRLIVLVNFNFRVERLGIAVWCVWRCSHSPNADCERADSSEDGVSLSSLFLLNSLCDCRRLRDPSRFPQRTLARTLFNSHDHKARHDGRLASSWDRDDSE